MSKKVMIIGAGIGGLFTAISLINEGFQVRIFEKASQISEVGAGIVLAANAINALGKVGLERSVRSNGSYVGKAEIRKWNGKLISELPINEQAKRYGTYSYLIRRSKLLSILIDKLDNSSEIYLNKTLQKVTQTDNNVIAYFADGTYEEADILIGADGINSIVREQLFGISKLQYSGYTAFRGICEISDPQYLLEDGGGFEAWGKGKRFGFSHLGQGKVFWFAAINSQEGRNIKLEYRKNVVKKHFEGWYPPVLFAIEATKESSILHHDIFDLPPLKDWSKGRVTLLGDAAHPMLPNLGQGGAQSMEDAIKIAKALKENTSIKDALLSYENTRKQRTKSIVKQSRKMGRMVQLEHPLTIMARNTFLKYVPKKMIISRLDWILGYKP